MATIGKKALAEFKKDKVDNELDKIRGWFDAKDMPRSVYYQNLSYVGIKSLILAHAHDKRKTLNFIYDFEVSFDQLDIEELNSKLELVARENDLHAIYIEREYFCWDILSVHKLHIEITK